MLFDAEVFNVNKQQIMAKTLALIGRPKSNVHPNTLLRLDAHSHIWHFAHAHWKSHRKRPYSTLHTGPKQSSP